MTNETIADIAAEKRRIAKEVRDYASNGDYWDRKKANETAEDLEEEADRLEAAWKRERAKIEADALEVGGIVEAAHRRERGDCAKLREAIEDLFAKGCVSRHDRVAVCPPCIDNEGYSPSNEWCARCSSDVKEKCMAIYKARAALAATEKEGGDK